MAHHINTMAYVGQTPWHGLGEQLQPNQPLEVWRRKAGMDWCIQEAPVCFQTEVSDTHQNMPNAASRLISALHHYDEQKVLYRSDSLEPLSVVSKRYQVVQPGEILEFYRSLVDSSGYELETAGVLKGGRKFWALAKTGQEALIGRKDQIKGYLLLATSCDGTLATTATPTTIRVVCNNTLAISVKGATQAIKVPHNTTFNGDEVKERLGLAVSHWDEFIYQMKLLAKRPVQDQEAKAFLASVLLPQSTQSKALTLSNTIKEKNGNVSSTPSFADDASDALLLSTLSTYQQNTLQSVLQMYQGHGRGAELGGTQNTAWGLLSSVTEYVDHTRRARSQDHRLDSAWFGQGQWIKQRALAAALALV